MKPKNKKQKSILNEPTHNAYFPGQTLKNVVDYSATIEAFQRLGAPIKTDAQKLAAAYSIIRSRGLAKQVEHLANQKVEAQQSELPADSDASVLESDNLSENGETPARAEIVSSDESSIEATPAAIEIGERQKCPECGEFIDKDDFQTVKTPGAPDVILCSLVCVKKYQIKTDVEGNLARVVDSENPYFGGQKISDVVEWLATVIAKKLIASRDTAEPETEKEQVAQQILDLYALAPVVQRRVIEIFPTLKPETVFGSAVHKVAPQNSIDKSIFFKGKTLFDLIDFVAQTTLADDFDPHSTPIGDRKYIEADELISIYRLEGNVIDRIAELKAGNSDETDSDELVCVCGHTEEQHFGEPMGDYSPKVPCEAGDNDGKICGCEDFTERRDPENFESSNPAFMNFTGDPTNPSEYESEPTVSEIVKQIEQSEQFGRIYARAQTFRNSAQFVHEPDSAKCLTDFAINEIALILGVPEKPERELSPEEKQEKSEFYLRPENSDFANEQTVGAGVKVSFDPNEAGREKIFEAAKLYARRKHNFIESMVNRWMYNEQFESTNESVIAAILVEFFVSHVDEFRPKFVEHEKLTAGEARAENVSPIVTEAYKIVRAFTDRRDELRKRNDELTRQIIEGSFSDERGALETMHSRLNICREQAEYFARAAEFAESVITERKGAK